MRQHARYATPHRPQRCATRSISTIREGMTVYRNNPVGAVITAIVIILVAFLVFSLVHSWLGLLILLLLLLLLLPRF
jgi:hypothetical protein